MTIRAQKYWTIALALGALAASSGCADEGAVPDEVGQTKQLLVASSIPMEVGVVRGVSDDGWISVPLDRSYTSPIVVATPVNSSATRPVVTRVSGAGGAGNPNFALRIDAFDNDQLPATSVDVTYFVIEEGTYDAATYGHAVEAVRMNSTVTDRKGSWSGEARTYAQAYTAPVVVGQVLSYNDAEPSVFWARGSGQKTAPNASNLRVGKHVGEDPNNTRGDETLGYVVFESGTSDAGNFLIEATLGADTIKGPTNGATSYNFANPGEGIIPVLSQAAMDGGNGSWAILRGTTTLESAVTDTTVTIAVDEDQRKDSERSHTTEQVAMVAFTPQDPCKNGLCIPDNCFEGATGPGIRTESFHLNSSNGAEMADIWCVTGDVNLSWNSEVTDLTALSSLVAVTGTLQIDENTGLTSLAGLENLESVGSLGMWDNQQLTSLNALSNLTSAGSVDITNHSQIPACEAWALGDRVGAQCDPKVNCLRNTGAGSCGTLPEGFICEMGATGPGVYEGDLFLSSDWGDDLAQFGGLTCVTGRVQIDNSGLTDLSGLSTLQMVGDEFSIWGDDTLTSLDGLEALTSVNYLSIENTTALSNLDGLANLSSASGVTITDNSALPACYAEQIGAQTGHTCDEFSCPGNTGTGMCE